MVSSRSKSKTSAGSKDESEQFYKPALEKYSEAYSKDEEAS
mgnify:CR=1 FL=1